MSQQSRGETLSEFASLRRMNIPKYAHLDGRHTCRATESRSNHDLDGVLNQDDKDETQQTGPFSNAHLIPSSSGFTCDTSWPPKVASDAQEILWDLDADSLTPWSSPLIEPPPPLNHAIYPLQTQPGYGVTVVPYDTAWPAQFDAIRDHLHNLFTTSKPSAPYTTIEHIGSTAVPGLAAKPNIDVLITFPTRLALDAGIEALEWEIPSQPPFVRYARVPSEWRIQGRESFKLRVSEWSEYYASTPERSVYLIDESEDNPAGRIHIRGYRSLRDTLRDPANVDLLEEYGQLKVELASRIHADAITYPRLKDGMIRKVLKRAGWTDEEVDEKERLGQRAAVSYELPY